jgi:hypothetical protein
MHVVTIAKETHILYFEPQNMPSKYPVNDELTKFFLKVFASKIADDIFYKGCHWCVCGEVSSNQDYTITMGGKEYITNSLALHYLQYHRDEVPQRDLDLIQQALNKVQK